MSEPAVTGSGDGGRLPEAAADPVGSPGAVLDLDGFELPEVAVDPGGGLELSDPAVERDYDLELPEALTDPAVGDGDVGPEVGGELEESVVALLPADVEVVEGPVDLPGPLRFEPEEYGAGSSDLGFHGYWPDRYTLEEFRDEVIVRLDSVLVRDGVLRGLVQNMSERLFARDVVVSVGDGRWLFPLTVQPTEVVPFVIEGYAGPSDPGLIGFEVAAALVPDPDPRRSFHFNGRPGSVYGTWEQMRSSTPNYEGDRPPEDRLDDPELVLYVTDVLLLAPTSHPSIADEVEAQTMGDLKAYFTKLDDDGRVLDVREMVPYSAVVLGVNEEGRYITEWSRVEEIPFHGVPGFDLSFLPDGTVWAMTVGGAYDGSAG